MYNSLFSFRSGMLNAMPEEKVLLVADIGTNERGFFHIGDEAMFWRTYQWYRAEHPTIKLGALTRGSKGLYPELTEHRHFDYPIGLFRSRLYFICLGFRFLLNRYLKLPLLSQKEYRLHKIILKYDVVHFTGGGNFYSHSPSWLYYMFFLLLVAFTAKKPVYLLSQTIGPFYWFDAQFARVFLNIPQLVALREPWEVSKNALQRYGIKYPQEERMLDVAYVSMKKSFAKRRSKNSYRVGLSVHDFDGQGARIRFILQEVIQKLSDSFDVTFVVLPHVLQRNDNEWDIWFMQKCFDGIDSQISVEIPLYEDIMYSGKHPVEQIQQLTADVDLLISSRYHGLVFGLASSVPCIGIRGGDYYNQKNRGLMYFLYGEEESKYSIDITSTSSEELFLRCKYMLKSLDAERIKIEDRNKKLTTRQDIFTLKKYYRVLSNGSLQTEKLGK